MKNFTIRQLKFANEICFSDQFLELWNKHSKGTELADFGFIYHYDFIHKNDRQLIPWVFKWSRADLAQKKQRTRKCN